MMLVLESILLVAIGRCASRREHAYGRTVVAVPSCALLLEVQLRCLYIVPVPRGSLVDVKAFQYFEAVCKHRSIPRAAAELGISAQGLSGSMTRLSQEVGAPLLSMGDGMVEPSAYGRVVLDHAMEINASLLVMRREVETLLAHDRNLVRVGFITGSLGYFGEGLIDEFNDLNANAQALVACEATNAEVLRCLQDGECDIAILAEKPGGKIKASELVYDDYFLWVSARNALSRRQRLSMSDLAGQVLAVFDLEPDLTEPFVLATRASGLDVGIRFVGEIMRVFELAHENRAVGLTCRNHVEATRGTDVVGIPFDLFPLTYYLCRRVDLHVSPVVESFEQFMNERKTRYGRRVG